MDFFGDTVKSSFAVAATANANPGFYPSEARFLRRATSGKQFFDNAVSHLKDFTNAKTVVIGIQEFHPPTLDQIMKAVTAKNPNLVAVPFSKDIPNKAKVLTIFDSVKLGDHNGMTYEEDLFNTPGLEFKPTDAGRPIQIFFTKNGYTIMNFQGTNRPRLIPDPSHDKASGTLPNLIDSNVNNEAILRTALQYHITKAIEKAQETNSSFNPDLSKLIITCDSNDREHNINSEAPLILNGLTFHDGRPKVTESKSCCYNLDSCGIDDNPEVREGGKIPKDMGEAGAESKYKYDGDEILVLNGNLTLTVVDSPQDDNGASIASDHKLVHATLNMAMAGGRRRKGRKTQKKVGKKAKKSRKVKRHNH